MPHVVDTDRLLGEGLISPVLADEIKRRSRETMVALAVNTILCAGILAATFGLIFWLADALAVAIAGGIFVLVGGWVLLSGSELYRMLGNAAALVGAGMLIGGAGIELIDKYEEVADVIMITAGAGIAAAALWVFRRGAAALGFAAGAVFLMGAAMHLAGLGVAFEDVTGWAKAGLFGYAALLIAAAGVIVDVRAVTALAIVPFAQMLDTGSAYYHAAYVFYSPEPTLTIVQMAALVGVSVWAVSRLADRIGRHAGILAIMGLVVGNLAFLVASLWGDVIGASLFESPIYDSSVEYSEWRDAVSAYEAQFLEVSEHVYSVVWAMLLGAGAFAAAHFNRRGLFNTAMTFAGIHGYTQMFESFGDEPLAWALGGLVAIPLAWGLWRFNQHWIAREAA